MNMLGGFLGTGSEQRSRSRSPGGAETRRKPSRQEYDDDSADEEPQYAQRRPSTKSRRDDYDDDRGTRYERRAPADDRRVSSRQDDSDENDRKPRASRAANTYMPVEEPKYKSSRDDRRERQLSSLAEDDRRSNRVEPRYEDAAPTGARPSYQRTADTPGAFPGQPVARPTATQYASMDKFEYAKPEQVRDAARNGLGSRNSSYSGQPIKSAMRSQEKQYQDDTYRSSREARLDRSDSDDYVRARQAEIDAQPRRGSYQRERSPLPPARRDASPNPATGRARSPNPMSMGAVRNSLPRVSTSGASLTVNGAPSLQGGRPPPSPMQEPYRGTYQDISPLPSPLSGALVRADDISDVELDDDLPQGNDPISRQIRALEKEKRRRQGTERNERRRELDEDDFISPRSSSNMLDARRQKPRAGSDVSTMSRSTATSKKTVSFYDPEPDARKIADGLKGTTRAPNVKPLLSILPWLTTDELITLKQEYKSHAKINGQGVNLSKHIKARIPGNLGKALYACSLGQYDSDAYWANCFYQSDKARRELLIESLVGRSNQQIREIKDVFKDKKYDDDLEKCMKTELKADKFRDAIIICLAERRMPEGLAIDLPLVRDDAEALYDLVTHAGGETQMMKIVLLRSNDHIREVLRYYEKSYRRNFVRDMLAKSQNLVGETLAHFLNGALNRAMRDALLLHQAINEFIPSDRRRVDPQDLRHDEARSAKTATTNAERAELLISRTVRLHWEPRHLEKVKREYEKRYKESVVRAIMRDAAGSMQSDDGKAWATFCADLCRSSEGS